MITKAQALDYSIAEFHYGTCTRTVGPRGGVTEKVVRVRRNGGVQTWKTRPDEWSMPVKYGMRARDQFRVTNKMAADWHAAADCPLAE